MVVRVSYSYSYSLTIHEVRGMGGHTVKTPRGHPDPGSTGDIIRCIDVCKQPKEGRDRVKEKMK